MAQRMRNEFEEDTTAIDIFGKFCEEGTEEEHHIVEGVEAMPEGRNDEDCHAVVETRSFARY